MKMNQPDMNRKLFLLLVAALSISGLLRADDAVKKLASVRDFAFGGVGVAGITSQGELAFRKVAGGKSAVADFAALLESGNAAARCYALTGLHVLAPDLFAQEIKRYEKDKTSVSTVSGCMIMSLPMSSVVANITAGRYDSYVKKK